MAKRLKAAPGGKAMRKRPSIRASRGFSKVRCSSVNASGGSSVPLASSATSLSPVPSEAVSWMGATGSAAGRSMPGVSNRAALAMAAVEAT
jgi:hypothetical protein